MRLAYFENGAVAAVITTYPYTLPDGYVLREAYVRSWVENGQLSELTSRNLQLIQTPPTPTYDKALFRAVLIPVQVGDTDAVEDWELVALDPDDYVQLVAARADAERRLQAGVADDADLALKVAMYAVRMCRILAKWKSQVTEDDLNTFEDGLELAQRIAAVDAIERDLKAVPGMTFDDPAVWAPASITVDRNEAELFAGNLPVLDRLAPIANGTINIRFDWHFVDTEGGSTQDELWTIEGGYEGQVVTLVPRSANRTIVVKDSSDNTGNIRCAGDFYMDDSFDSITLKKRGTRWVMLSTSDNGN